MKSKDKIDIFCIKFFLWFVIFMFSKNYKTNVRQIKHQNHKSKSSEIKKQNKTQFID